MTEEIASGAGIVILERSSLRLVRRSDADAFVDACRDSRCQVLGIEGFRIVGGRTWPDMGAIADFSSLTTVRESVDEAHAFLAHLKVNDLLFEFTLTYRRD